MFTGRGGAGQTFSPPPGLASQMEVDKVADMVFDKKRKRKKVADMEMDMVADMEVDKVADIEVDTVGYGGRLIRPKPFRPKANPVCASSKLCEFIHTLYCIILLFAEIHRPLKLSVLH